MSISHNTEFPKSGYASKVVASKSQKTQYSLQFLDSRDQKDHVDQRGNKAQGVSLEKRGSVEKRVLQEKMDSL